MLGATSPFLLCARFSHKYGKIFFFELTDIKNSCIRFKEIIKKNTKCYRTFCKCPFSPIIAWIVFPVFVHRLGTFLLGCHDSSLSPESDTPLVIGSNQSAEDIDHCAEIYTPKCIDGQIAVRGVRLHNYGCASGLADHLMCM